jgi:glycerol-3-phosphate cytidylyltransferase-like family protein
MGVVDDIVLGAPWTVSQDMVKSLGIDVVIAGKTDKLSFAEQMPYPYRHAECCIVRLIFVVAVTHKRLASFKRSIVVAKSPLRPSWIGLWISTKYTPSGTQFGR